MSLVNSGGTPKNEKNGESSFVSAAESPDISNNSHIMKIAARQGISEKVNLTASDTPAENSSYIFTFLNTAKPKTAMKTTGIIYAKVYAPEYIKLLPQSWRLRYI